MKDSYNEYFIGELADLTRDDQIRLIAGADDYERITMKILDTTKPNKNARVYKGFEPGKIYYDTDNCLPSIRSVRSISPITVMDMVVATGALILEELSSYKVSYSDYINEYRYDYTERISSVYTQLLNLYTGAISFSRPAIIKQLPQLLANNKGLLRNAIKAKINSIYGWYSRR